MSDPLRPDWSYLRPMASILSGSPAVSLLGVITATLLTLSLVGCAPEESATGRPVAAPANIGCPGEPVPTELTVTCHRIEVEGASLSVAVLHAPDPDGAPVLFLHGGPGGRAVADRDRWLAPRSKILANHDVVLVDQRGGGNSTPSLDCPEMEHRGPQDNAQEGLAGDRSCRNRLVSAGFEPSTVTVGRIAADLVAVRQALAIDRWHLHGVSFGTRIALELLRTDDAAIVSLALDSVVPPDADETADLPDGIVAALTKLEDRCTDDGFCPIGVLEPLRRTLDRLAHDPTVVQVDNRSLTFDDTAFLAASVRTLSRPDGPVALTEAIALADAGRLAEAVDRLAPVDASAGTSRSAGDALAEGAWVAVTCGDQRPGMSFEPTDLNDPIHRAEHGRWLDLRARCAAWKIPPSDPATRTPVRSAVPTLILAGELDPVTPARWAATVARWLDDVEVVVSPRWTHAPSTWNSCAAHLVTRFLDTGDRPTGGSTDC
ncbi:MAG: alpha/beta fold hydrolase [Acidimicrobiales bacterium]|nr:alpha/beta fold hydrolase [Acidimicrobiales bacterium]